MGEFNSSVTRVWPVFDCLLHRDPTGASWLASLLRMSSQAQAAAPGVADQPGMLLGKWVRRDRPLPAILRKVLGPERAARIGCIRQTFEEEAPPTESFLRWLIKNPDQMQWPRDRHGVERTFGASTQHKRKSLLGGDPRVQDEALGALTVCGAMGSRRKWWAFEGFTSVDCWLETERLLLFVEGKRTEDVSAATDWFPKRNQVIRNLEVARALAKEDQTYAVLICAENDVQIPEHAWAESLPHMCVGEQEELRSHFLGCVTWGAIARDLCDGMKLPDRLDEAVDFCQRFHCS